jgi:hypothetical protein
MLGCMFVQMCNQWLDADALRVRDLRDHSVVPPKPMLAHVSHGGRSALPAGLAADCIGTA